MKKLIMKTIGLWFFVAIIFAPLCGWGDDFLDDDLYYGFESGSDTRVYVSGLKNTSAASITIPRTVVYEWTDYSDIDDEGPKIKHRSCTVKSIRDWAFRDCSSLTSVTISSSVTSIGERAFSGCSGLTSVTIPDSVTSIGYEAFFGCIGLTSVTIPSSVTSIDSHAFSGCSSLTSVTIPSSVTSIGNDAFYGCSSLTSVTIPDSVTSIGDRAFNSCSSLTSVTIGNGVTSIGSSAFGGCSSLKEVHLSDIAAWCGVEMDSSEATPFYYGADLYVNGSRVTYLQIPDGVTRIANYAFYKCTSLESVAIPDSVPAVGKYSFDCSPNIVSVTVPQCIMDSGLSSYFQNYSNIRHLKLGASVVNIREGEFYNYKSLTTIEVAADNPAYFVSPIDGCLYDREQTTLLCCPRGKTSITVPYGVTKIGNYAFAYCTNLVSVALPVTLKEIGQNAFLDCANLPTVAIPDGVTKIDNYAFGNCRKLKGVTIPSGVQALSTSAFNNCDILWTEWYRTLADFAVNGRAYDLTQTPGDRAIADVTVNGDMALDAFVLKEGKVYDSVLYVHNNADHAVKVTLPSIPLTEYKTFKGATPLTLPAYSTSILTITRVAGGNAGGNVFLVSREELETVK